MADDGRCGYEPGARRSTVLMLVLVALATCTAGTSFGQSKITTVPAQNDKWRLVSTADKFTDDIYCELRSSNSSMIIDHNSIFLSTEKHQDIDRYFIRFDRDDKIHTFEPSRKEREFGTFVFDNAEYNDILSRKRMRVRVFGANNQVSDYDFDIESANKLLKRWPKQCPKIANVKPEANARNLNNIWARRKLNKPNLDTEQRAMPHTASDLVERRNAGEEFVVPFSDGILRRQTVWPPKTDKDPGIGGAAILYTETPDNPQQPRALNGRVVWRLDTESAGQGRLVETIVRATIEIPDAGLGLDFTIRRNTDLAFPASHIIGLRFTGTGNQVVEAIREIGVPQFKTAESERGVPLSAINSALGENLFVAVLSNVPDERARNMDMLLKQNWIDIPIKFASGKRGIVTLEKGVAGNQTLADAYVKWQ